MRSARARVGLQPALCSLHWKVNGPSGAPSQRGGGHGAAPAGDGGLHGAPDGGLQSVRHPRQARHNQ